MVEPSESSMKRTADFFQVIILVFLPYEDSLT